MGEMNHPPHASVAQRKQQLVKEAAAYRAGLANAADEVKACFGAESIAKNAIAHLGMLAYGIFKGRAGLAGAGLQTLLPFLINGISGLSKKSSLGKSILRSAVVIGTVAALVRLFIKKRNANAKQQGNSDSH